MNGACPNPIRPIDVDGLIPNAFFQPCQARAFTYPRDPGNANGLCDSNVIECCIGSDAQGCKSIFQLLQIPAGLEPFPPTSLWSDLKVPLGRGFSISSGFSCLLQTLYFFFLISVLTLSPQRSLQESFSGVYPRSTVSGCQCLWLVGLFTWMCHLQSMITIVVMGTSLISDKNSLLWIPCTGYICSIWFRPGRACLARHQL